MTGWSRAQDVTIDYWNNTDGAWVNATTVTNISGEPALVMATVYENGDAITKIRYTLTDFQSDTCRITSLFWVCYNSPLLNATYMSRGGGALYGSNAAPPEIKADGGDTNIKLRFRPKGNESIDFVRPDNAVMFSVAGSAGGGGNANYPTVSGSNTGNPVAFSCWGSDTNVSINVTPKGTGNLQLNGVAIPTISSTDTLTNKRVNPRTTTVSAPGGTPTVATDSYNQIDYTGLAAAITSMTTNLSGTPVNGQVLYLTFTDNGTARAIAWGASFIDGPAALLTTTIANKVHEVALKWSAVKSKWVCMASHAAGY
jgi:hypothetical protein